jgi:hypothetical protein
MPLNATATTGGFSRSLLSSVVQKNNPRFALNYAQKAHTGNSSSISPPSYSIPREKRGKRWYCIAPKRRSMDR